MDAKSDYDGTPLPTRPVGKRVQREKAREMLMHGISVTLGYWSEQDPKAAARLGITDEDLNALLWQEADRVARLLGFEEAWAS